jgi:DNA-binding PadR family transcriptional regulator
MMEHAMFRRWFDSRVQFEDDDEMAGRRGPPRPRPPGPPGHGGPGGPGGPWGFGGPPWGGRFGEPPWGNLFSSLFGRGPRARRGDVRAAILTLLAEQPLNGYQIMQAIEQRSHGSWKPSSGSIYPTLQQLEDEDLVETESAKPGQSGSKIYQLTTKGKRYVDEHRAELEAGWQTTDDTGGADPRWELVELFRQVASAAMQVAHSGTAVQLDQAKQMLRAVRRDLYRILAEMPGGADDDA